MGSATYVNSQKVNPKFIFDIYTHKSLILNIVEIIGCSYNGVPSLTLNIVVVHTLILPRILSCFDLNHLLQQSNALQSSTTFGIIAKVHCFLKFNNGFYGLELSRNYGLGEVPFTF